jgi:hypothetical protein
MVLILSPPRLTRSVKICFAHSVSAPEIAEFFRSTLATFSYVCSSFTQPSVTFPISRSNTLLNLSIPAATSITLTLVLFPFTGSAIYSESRGFLASDGGRAIAIALQGCSSCVAAPVRHAYFADVMIVVRIEVQVQALRSVWCVFATTFRTPPCHAPRCCIVLLQPC